MLPDNAIMAVVAYPKRVLETAPHLKPLLNDMQADIGIAPLDVEQVAMIFGFEPPGHRQPGVRSFDSAVVVRMAAPHGGEKFVADFLAPAKPEKIDVGGKSLYHVAEHGPSQPHGRPPCIYLLDDRTFVAGEESDLRAMLAVTEVKSPLAKLLGTAAASDDVSVVLANNDELAKSLADAKKLGELPPPMMAFGDLPGLMNSLVMTIKTAPEASLKLTADAKDAAGAEKVAAAIAPAKQMLSAISASLRTMSPPNAPSEQKGLVDYALGKLDKIVAGLTPKQDGSRVTIEIDGLGTVDEWAEKAAPAISAARDASQRMISLNNLKQLSIAMLSSESDTGEFPARAILSQDGKPLLSWRVAMLKYLGEDDLYKQFHLDEPWDSEHNKPLIAQMPREFTDPLDKGSGDGHTRYVVPTGKDTVFDGDKGVRIADITDGSSNTLLIVEVGSDKSVVWTKPDDLTFDPQQPLAGLGTIAAHGLAAAFS